MPILANMTESSARRSCLIDKALAAHGVDMVFYLSAAPRRQPGRPTSIRRFAVTATSAPWSTPYRPGVLYDFTRLPPLRTDLDQACSPRTRPP